MRKAILLSATIFLSVEPANSQVSVTAVSTQDSLEILKHKSQLARAQQAAAELAIAEADAAIAKTEWQARERNLLAVRAKSAAAVEGGGSLPVSTSSSKDKASVASEQYSSDNLTESIASQAPLPLAGAPSSTGAGKVAAEAKKDLNSADKPAVGGASDSVFSVNLSAGAAIFLLKGREIETAIISGNKVLVTESRSHKVTPWLQANYMMDRFRFGPYVSPGIFVGLGGGDGGDFLNTFGGGVLVSFKRTRIDDITNKTSLNLGVGYYLSTTKRLANGIIEGQPLPDGFESIQYKKKSTNGLMMNLSFGF